MKQGKNKAKGSKVVRVFTSKTGIVRVFTR